MNKYQYIIVDGCLHGSGLRNGLEGGYISPADIALDAVLQNELQEWLAEYETQYYENFQDAKTIDALDEKGTQIARALKASLPESKIEYYSAATLVRRSI